MTPAPYSLRIRQDAARDDRWLDTVSASESPGIREALEHLVLGEITEAALEDMVRDTDGADAVPKLFFWLTRLQQEGQLQYGLRLSDGSSIDVVPERPGRVFSGARFELEADYVASRFAFLRRVGGEMQLESPLRSVVIRFRSWLPGAVVAMLGQPVSARSIASSLPAASPTDVIAIVELLVLTGVVERPRREEPSAEGLWDFHELLFHDRSSTARLGHAFAGLHQRRQPEPPAIRAAVAGSDPIALPPPRLEQWMTDDPPLARVMEQRRSAVVPAPHRLTIGHMSEFLYRTMHTQTDAHRVLPGAGARHELELYLVVHDVDGLLPGCYHYHSSTHVLHRLTADGDVVAECLDRAKTAWSSGAHTPSVAIVVAARFPRMAARYAAIAYRNTMLDAGIAIEAMYLNATAMRLAPCALGINLPDLFARMTGLDPFEETPVAVFTLNGVSE